jgi:RNA polymerase-binding transcription factor DksA
MKQNRIRACRQQLEEKRARLLRSLQSAREGKSSVEGLLHESRLLWVVDAALQAIADGIFGKCLFCQRTIPSKRLAAVPWSAYCSSCEKLAEAYVYPPANLR